MVNSKLSSNEATVRANLLKWVKLSENERRENASSILHEIYGNMCSTDKRADDGESLAELFTTRAL